MTTQTPLYTSLAYAHLATVVPAFLIGTALLLRKKGSPSHKTWGRVYAVLMLVTSLISLAMPAVVGPRLAGHFGFIHIFSVVVLWCIPRAVWHARRGEIAAHKGNMLGVYIGGLLVAGGFAFMPGRMLHTMLFT
jgi:uncharacterized membrane protein